MSLMISVSGIRGVFGEDLNPQNLSRFASAFGHWTGGGTVVIGRDTRTTGALCERAVTAALQATGCRVISLGVAPTPTVAMGVLEYQASGGIVISASHNPPQWNALKLLNESSEFLDQKQGEHVMKLAGDDGISYTDYQGIGTVEEDHRMVDRHIDRILELPYIDPETIRAAGLHVALDAVNGAGSESMPRLLERLGVEQVQPVHCTPDGHFPHNPEPLAEHLQDLCQAVSRHGCHIGLAVDPDADRLALVDESGAPFGEEYTFVTALDFMMARRPGTSVVNLSSSRASEDVALRHGQQCLRSPVGEINVVKHMQTHQAVLGGEGNGGVINPDLHYGRDALVGAAMVLQHLAETGRRASEVRSSYPDYVMIKDRISVEGMDVDSLLEKVAARYREQATVNTLDGVKIDFDDGWIHMRPSNTEPILRIYAEAGDAQRSRELAESVKEFIARHSP